MNFVHRHQSLRKKKAVEKTARPKRLLRSIDLLVYIVTFFSLVFTLDQVRIIWVEHNAQGVSFMTFGLYVISAGTWLCYGLLHKERVIILSNILWVCIYFAIAVGILIYQ